MMNKTVIVISNDKQYFFTTDHCQRVRTGGVPDKFSGEEWVPITHYLPTYIFPRVGFENGVVDTVDQLIFIFYSDRVEIPNPNPDYSVY